MNTGYYFEIVDGTPTHYCFSYIDSEDNLADFLFDHMKIIMEKEMEFHYNDDPFKVVMCRIPRRQREDFLKAIEVLPGLMAYAGREGYDEFCMDLMRNAAEYFSEKEEKAKITPLR